MHTEERIARLEGETGHLAMNAGIEAVRGEIEKLSATLTSGLSPRVRGNPFPATVSDDTFWIHHASRPRGGARERLLSFRPLLDARAISRPRMRAARYPTGALRARRRRAGARRRRSRAELC